MAETAIIILNWNNRSFLEQFLPVLINHTPASLADIIIADNASTDDSVGWLEANYPDLQIIRMDQNYGFAGGYNRAIAACEHKQLVILNSDIEVTEQWLEPLLEKLSQKNIAAVMPKVKSWHRQEQFEYAGAAGGFIDRYGYPFCRGRLFDEIETDRHQYDEAIPVHWATGACMIIKRAVFNLAGGFDGDFFAHMEEIDLCWRIRRLGFEIWAVPQSTVYHVGGGTLPNESPTKLYLNFRNNLALLYKNLPNRRLSSGIFMRMILDGVAALVYLSKGKFRFIGSILKAHRDFYRWKPKLKSWRQNNSLPESRTDQFKPISIVWKHFVSGKKFYSDL